MTTESSPAEALRQFFPHSSFRPGQEETIRILLEGRSALAILPTGGGKSLCYQLPALLLPGLTVVVSPLIALMKDQVDFLKKSGLAAARLDSSLPPAELEKVNSDLENRTCRMLFLAPERLANQSLLHRLQKIPISLLAVDEAHCVSEWGHNFRPDYLRIARLAKKLKVPRVLALTATATPAVTKDIRARFHIRLKDVIQTSFHRSNLHLRITPVPADKRLSLLRARLQNGHGFPAIVYVTLQETAERVAAELREAGLKARAYHAGMAAEVRESAQEDFMADRIDIMVATIAFGMGIDKSNIRSVFHYNLPKTLENYQQEIGRAGRDGKPAHCELLACGDDRIPLANFTLGDTPGAAALRSLVDHLLRSGEQLEISLYDLSRTTDIRRGVLETVLANLEEEKILIPEGSYYSSIQLGFEQPEGAILRGCDSARQQQLRNLFSLGQCGRRWITVDLQEAARRMNLPMNGIEALLADLEAAGEVTLKRKGLRHRYRVASRGESLRPREIADRLIETFQLREKQNLLRLNAVLAFATDPGCSTRHLLGYFGENLPEGCGHCAHCLDGPGPGLPLPASPIPEITLEHIDLIRSLQKVRPPSLRTSRQLARFLCGLHSPATSRDRMTTHDGFGLLSKVPFQDVLHFCK